MESQTKQMSWCIVVYSAIMRNGIQLGKIASIDCFANGKEFFISGDELKLLVGKFFFADEVGTGGP